MQVIHIAHHSIQKEPFFDISLTKFPGDMRNMSYSNKNSFIGANSFLNDSPVVQRQLINLSQKKENADPDVYADFQKYRPTCSVNTSMIGK